MRFERLSIEEGLSQSTVNCILQDRTGFLWLGTQGGLNRYDGYRFEVYRHDGDDPATLAHDWVLELVEDSSGDLWVGTEGGGLSRWHRETDTFSTYRHDPTDPRSLSGDRIVGLAGDRAGTLWVATLASGLNRFDPADGTFERFRHHPDDPGSLAHDQTGTVYVDPRGDVWVGTWGGLDLYQPESRTFAHFRHDPADSGSLSDDRVRAILEDSAGRLWVGTHHGLNRIDRRSGRVERFLHDPPRPGSLSHDWVRTLYQGRDGRLWVGTDGGLNLWREDDRNFIRYHRDPADPQSLGGNQVLALHQDRSGVLWVSTIGTGVNKWNPATWTFTHYRSATAGDGASPDAVFALSEDRAGGVWIGTFGGGLKRLDRSSGHRLRYTHDPADAGSLADDRVTALLHDRAGVLWVGTVDGGLHRLNPHSDQVAGDEKKTGASEAGRFERFRHDPRRPDSLSRDAVTALHQDRRGRLWVGTWRAGLNLYRGDGTFLRLRHDPEDSQSLGHDQVFALGEDAIGRLWVATDGGGLNRLDPRTLAFFRLRHDPGDPGSLASDELLSVHVDDADRVWAGTKANGLDRLMSFDDRSGEAVFRNYSAADGLPDETIWSLVSDAAGSLWIATSNGLSRLDPETEAVRNYDTSHGLQSNEFNQGAAFRSASGELFFGGFNGWNAFFPDRVRGNIEPPPVVLSGFTRFNQPVDLGRPLFDLDHLELSYRDHFLAFEFAALDFTAPEKNRYRYQLAGLDDAWVELGHERRVTFTDLDPGRYTLRVRGSNNDGVWNEEGARVRIVVRPPPWKTWWATSLYALILGAAVFGLLRYRVRANLYLAEQVAERTRELAEKNRELSAKNREILRAETQLVQSEKMAALGQLVAGVAHELNNPVNFISSGVPSLRRDVDKLTALVADDRRDERFHKVQRRIGKLLRAIGDGARRTAETVRDLRSFARPDEAELKVADLHAALESTLTLLHHQTKDHIEVVRHYGRIPTVECWLGQLNQVFMNLLVNAVQAIRGEGAIVLTTERLGDRVRVSIRDTGRGMSEDERAKIFDPFFTTKPEGQGTGLGLAISHGIVEKHGGTIEVESAPGKGTEFTITLPLTQEIP